MLTGGCLSSFPAGTPKLRCAPLVLIKCHISLMLRRGISVTNPPVMACRRLVLKVACRVNFAAGFAMICRRSRVERAASYGLYTKVDESPRIDTQNGLDTFCPRA